MANMFVYAYVVICNMHVCNIQTSYVLCTLQVSNVTTMIDRIIDEFPSDSDINEIKGRINETLQLATNSQ